MQHRINECGTSMRMYNLYVIKGFFNSFNLPTNSSNPLTGCFSVIVLDTLVVHINMSKNYYIQVKRVQRPITLVMLTIMFSVSDSTYSFIPPVLQDI